MRVSSELAFGVPAQSHVTCKIVRPPESGSGDNLSRQQQAGGGTRGGRLEWAELCGVVIMIAFRELQTAWITRTRRERATSIVSLSCEVSEISVSDGGDPPLSKRAMADARQADLLVKSAFMYIQRHSSRAATAQETKFHFNPPPQCAGQRLNPPSAPHRPPHRPYRTGPARRPPSRSWS